MKIGLRCALCAALLAGPRLSAQTPNPDFAGVYVATGYVAIAGVVEPEVYPFTDVGRAAYERFDPTTAPNQSDDCVPIPMPGVIFNGDPMEIIREDDTLVFRYERLDMRRTIHMDGASPAADQPRSGLGYSVGRWVGNDELVIETTHLLGGVIQTNMGHPLSADARLTERYWRAPGTRDLHVELLIEDPVNYAETVRLGRELVWSTEDEVQPWGCVDFGPKDAELDIDEFVRMLEGL